jgi:hypothetical protein
MSQEIEELKSRLDAARVSYARLLQVTKDQNLRLTALEVKANAATDSRERWYNCLASVADDLLAVHERVRELEDWREICGMKPDPYEGKVKDLEAEAEATGGRGSITGEPR